MRKKWIRRAALLLAAALVWFLFGWHFTSYRQQRISLPITEVVPLVGQLENWKQWYPPAVNASLSFSKDTLQCPGGFLLIKKSFDLNHLDVILDSAASVRRFGIFLVADSFGMATRVVEMESLSPFSWFVRQVSPQPHWKSPLEAFLDFSGDPKKIYGFEIGVRKVADTLILTDHQISPISQRLKTLGSLLDRLRLLAVRTGAVLDSSSRPMASFSSAGPDSVVVMAGLPLVNKGHPVTGSFFLEMPPKGKMLVGAYRGPYGDLRKLYVQMQRYVERHHMVRIAAPFEKYFSAPLLPGSDTLHMQVELFYPIL